MRVAVNVDDRSLGRDTYRHGSDGSGQTTIRALQEKALDRRDLIVADQRGRVPDAGK